MKNASLGLCLLIVMSAGALAKAQCGCGTSYPSYYAPPPVYQPSYPPVSRYAPPSVPRTPSLHPSSVAYVNKLASPIPRANYTLNYAVHLTDGRILLTDFLPPGHTIRGIESQSGSGGRRLSASNSAGGTINITDPSSNSTVATFTPPAVAQ